MDSPPEPLHHLHRNLTQFLHTTNTSLLSLLSPPKTISPLPPSKNCTPLLFSESPLQFPQSLFESPQSNSVSSLLRSRLVLASLLRSSPSRINHLRSSLQDSIISGSLWFGVASRLFLACCSGPGLSSRRCSGHFPRESTIV